MLFEEEESVAKREYKRGEYEIVVLEGSTSPLNKEEYEKEMNACLKARAGKVRLVQTFQHGYQHAGAGLKLVTTFVFKYI